MAAVEERLAVKGVFDTKNNSRYGPPLPGDLGRPIFESQRRMVTETAGALSDRFCSLRT